MAEEEGALQEEEEEEEEDAMVEEIEEMLQPVFWCATFATIAGYFAVLLLLLMFINSTRKEFTLTRINKK